MSSEIAIELKFPPDTPSQKYEINDEVSKVITTYIRYPGTLPYYSINAIIKTSKDVIAVMGYIASNYVLVTMNGKVIRKFGYSVKLRDYYLAIEKRGNTVCLKTNIEPLGKCLIGLLGKIHQARIEKQLQSHHRYLNPSSKYLP